MKSDKENHWVFRLFVSKTDPATNRTVSMLEEICDDYLKGTCEIKIINVSEDPQAGMEENIIATPTLIKKLPEPVRRLIGDLTDKEKLILHLDIIKNK